MIEVKNLTKHFGKKIAVQDVSFRLEAGETMALIGTSGCGKTTTLKMINRLVEPTKGEIYVDDINAMEQPAEEMRRKMGYVIQNIGLFPHYTVEENISVVPNLLKWDKEKISDRVHNLMRRLKLPPAEYAKLYPAQLSGGQQQRVGLARALAGDPPIILMDEPFGALDPVTRRDIRNDFKEMEELNEKTIILITHDLAEAFEMADFICVLHEGEVQQIGSSKELLFQPANDFIRNFLTGKMVELQFNVFTLKDLFEHLPDKKWDHRSDKFSFTEKTTLKEVLEKLSRYSPESNLASVEVNGKSKLFNLQTLMTSYHRSVNP